MPPPSEFELGLLVGLMVHGIHFGGDRKQPQAVLRFTEAQRPLQEWVQTQLPGGRIYGPYSYTYRSDGRTRTFSQLMFRGDALKTQLMPLLERFDWSFAAPEAYARYEAMKRRFDLATADPG